MRAALINMLTMQNRMNTRVHPQWIDQHYEWYRAAWIECGELMDHVGYKWWKKQSSDWEQVRLEVVDIWHFGLSALFTPDADIESMADAIAEVLESPVREALDIHTATENLALECLQTKGFSVAHFRDLMMACELTFDELYRHYVGKNVLNFFRQDHGYKDGSYVKIWQGREDNEHLSELIADLDAASDSFPDDVYAGLKARYSES